MRTKKRALQGNRHVRIPGHLAETEEVDVGGLRRVVYEYVNRSERLVGRLDHGFDLGRVGYVCCLGRGVATRIENILRNRDRASPRYVSDYDGGALFSETLGQYPTHPRAGPRYDGNLVLDPHLRLPTTSGTNIDETVVPRFR